MRLTAIERAYEIARSGDVKRVLEIERRLKLEGYENVLSHLHGAATRRELGELCRAAFQRRSSEGR